MRVAEYKRLLTEAYDLDKPEAPPAELERWRRHATAATGPVLEVMCGSGRFLVPLAEAGIDIDGVDASPAMLDVCADKCAARGLAPGLYTQFACELALPRRYALLFVAAGSFGLLVEPDDYRASLRAMFEHLAPGGHVILDAETVAAARTANGRWLGRWWTRADGATIAERRITRSTADVEEGLNIYELFVDGRLVETEMNDWVRRFWTADSFAAELTAAGFADVNVRGVLPDAAGAPVGLVAHARRAPAAS